MGLGRRIAARLGVMRSRALVTLTLGHFTLDMYGGLLPVLYPLLRDKFEINLATVGTVSLAYTGVAALTQPLFGWVADRYGTRYLGAALVWTAVLFATIGFAPNFEALVVLAGLAGLGSAAYHPMGAMSASAVIPAENRNTGMSLYISGGTLGVASGPLLGAALFGIFGVRGTGLMVLPGLSIAIWMLIEMRRASQAAMRRGGEAAGRRARPSLPPAPIPWLPLGATVGVMMLRAWTLFGIQAFIPSWYKSLGYSAEFYGPLATTVVLAGAAGNIGWGTLADRIGRRGVIVSTTACTIPVILLFAQFTGPIAFPLAALLGFLAAATGPLMLVTAQQLMQGRAGLASGLILGLGFVTGAIGVPIMGAIGDAYGMPTAMRSQAIVALLTIGVAMLLPAEARRGGPEGTPEARSREVEIVGAARRSS